MLHDAFTLGLSKVGWKFVWRQTFYPTFRDGSTNSVWDKSGVPPAFVSPERDPLEARLNWDSALKWPDQRHELERRLIDERLPAARLWARANGLDRLIVEAPERRLGVVTVGKAHQDLMQACADLGLAANDLRALGISIYKVAM